MPIASNFVLAVNFLEHADEILEFFDEKDQDPLVLLEDFDNIFDKIQTYKSVTVDAWIRCMVARGYNPTPSKRIDGYFNIKENKEEVTPWGLELYYDTGELYQEPKDALIGINLTTRYFGTYLDAKYPHGGSDEAIPIMRYVHDAEIAKKAIATIFPFMKDAEVYGITQFY